MTDQEVARAFAVQIAIDPEQAARNLYEVDPGSSIALAQALGRQLSADPLARLAKVWDLTVSQVADVFGVSRQAYAKWRKAGVPNTRQLAVRQMDESTRMLMEYVNIVDIPNVVRRKTESLGKRSLLEMATAHEYEAVSEAVRAAVEPSFGPKAGVLGHGHQ